MKTRLTLHEDGLYRDERGTVHAIPDPSSSVDDTVRAGVGPISLPEDHWTTDGIRAHDFAYSSPQYQRTHPRSEADRMLRDHLLAIADGRPTRVATAHLFYGLSRAFGWLFWECSETRWK